MALNMEMTFNSLFAVTTDLRAYGALIIFFALLFLSSFLKKSSLPVGTPKSLPGGFPGLGQLQLFSRRCSFYFNGVSSTLTGNFHFHIGQHQFVGLSGEDGRKTFFEDRSLEFCQAYRNMFVPIPPSIGKRLFRSRSTVQYHSRADLKEMVSWENLSQNLSSMVGYTSKGYRRIVERYGSTGVIDPFDELDLTVYQSMLCIMGLPEIAETEGLLQKSLGYYHKSNLSTSAARIIVPWFPTPSSLQCLVASIQQCTLVRQVLERRKASQQIRKCVTQSMIDRGLGYREVCQFVTMTLFAAQANTPVISSWILIFLAHDPYWMEQIRAEVERVVARRRTNSYSSPEEILGSLDLAAWESEFPTIDLCARETLRLYGGAAAYRVNYTGEDLPIGKSGEVIPQNAYAFYFFDQVHYDPSIYPMPNKWDPGRYLAHRAEDKKVPLSWLGWGAGAHICTGMRFAKLQMNITIAHFVAKFDFSLCDGQGYPMAHPPASNRDKQKASRPDTPVKLRYTERPIW